MQLVPAALPDPGPCGRQRGGGSINQSNIAVPRFSSVRHTAVFRSGCCCFIPRRLLGAAVGRGRGMEMENLTRSGSQGLLWPTCHEKEQAQSLDRVLREEASLATVGVVVLACLLAAVFGLRKPFRRRVSIKSTAGQAGWFGVVEQSLRFCSVSLRLLSPFSVGRSLHTR